VETAPVYMAGDLPSPQLLWFNRALPWSINV